MAGKNFQERIRDYILKDINDSKFNASDDIFWKKLKETGTTLWLDTGDMEEAENVLTAEFEALTTNNTLINKVIQKGVYDSFISRTAELVSPLAEDQQVEEIAFILNARHGLRLCRRFGGYVSVELHTNTAYDIDSIVNYGLRYHEINPDRFIVKVPLTSSGLIGARLLKEKGVRINFTLGFSARQNVLTAFIARPDFLNVFMGRIGAYIADNKLGDGKWAGEKAVIETQRAIRGLRDSEGFSTRLIAASLRNHNQLASLAGTDLFTIPPAVAKNGRKELDGRFVNNIATDYNPMINYSMEETGISKFWEVPDQLVMLSRELGNNLPSSGDDIERKLDDGGFGDIFPELDSSEKNHIRDDGKIPVFDRWKAAIREKRMAPDTLLNFAGLASFTTDQGQLDDRIRSTIGF